MANGVAVRPFSSGFSPMDSLAESGPSIANLSTGFGASRLGFGARLPREGAKRGGGRMEVMDRSIYEEGVRDIIILHEDTHEPPAGLNDNNRATQMKKTGTTRGNSSGSNTKEFRRESTRPTSKAALGPAEQPESPRSATSLVKDMNVLPRASPEERKHAEIVSKYQKSESLRAQDRKDIREKVERQKDMRESRFKRLLESVTGDNNVAYKTALDLRDREEREAMRRQARHDEWNEKVYHPMASQAFDYLNPPDRAALQKQVGYKRVSWNMPGRKFKLSANVHEDPNRRPIVDNARESSFHQTAGLMLGQSQSAPNIHTVAATSHGSFLPRALSRPVLEPTNWSHVALQGTLYGMAAQVAEHGPGFTRTKRGGPDVHLPDETDGVPVAGTRLHRAEGYCHKGILHGDVATSGESSGLRMEHGAGWGAPAQDHFLFETGHNVTNLEFPLGKRAFPPPV